MVRCLDEPASQYLTLRETFENLPIQGTPSHFYIFTVLMNTTGSGLDDDDEGFDSENEMRGREDRDDILTATQAERVVQSRKRRLEIKEVNERAQAAYVEAHDMEASRAEEKQLWELIQEEPPTRIKNEPSELPASNQTGGLVKETGGAADWRGNTVYWSEWETLPTPVPEENFAINRLIRAPREKRGRRKSRSRSVEGGTLLSSIEVGEDREDRSVSPVRRESDEEMRDVEEEW